MRGRMSGTIVVISRGGINVHRMVAIDDSPIGSWGHGGHMVEVKIAGASRCVDAFDLYGMLSDLFIRSAVLFESCDAVRHLGTTQSC